MAHAGYAAHFAWHSFEAGAPLARVQQRARHYQLFACQQNNDVLMQLLRCYEQLILCLQGVTGADGSLDDAGVCARDALAVMERASYGAARTRYYLLRKVAAYSFGRFDEALHAQLPRDWRGAVMRALRAKRERLRAWAGQCAANFDDRYLLVSAEIDRLEGRDLDAMRGYDAALASAGGTFLPRAPLRCDQPGLRARRVAGVRAVGLVRQGAPPGA